MNKEKWLGVFVGGTGDASPLDLSRNYLPTWYRF